MATRDIVVVGSSMGGIQALSSLAGQLPEDLPAALIVVQHTSPDSPGLLGEILCKRGVLPAVTAEDGMAIERGHIYVAPPNRHLIAGADGLRVTFGPRENRSRPAIDPLFRTAAVNYRSRVIGVVLTGLLGDGAAGLLAIDRCGGIALVQEPEDAAYPDMPRRALDYVRQAQKFVIGDLGKLLTTLCGTTAPAPPPIPEALMVESRLTESGKGTEDWGAVPSRPTNFTCPECRGAIHEVGEKGLTRFRCRIGHAYSSIDLLEEKAKTVEDTLWMALQTLEERAQMLELLAADDAQRGWEHGVGTFGDKARETRAHANRLRELLVNLPM